jgi:hypothetical protein
MQERRLAGREHPTRMAQVDHPDGKAQAVGVTARISIGFDSKDDRFDYRLQSKPRFAKRMGPNRASLRAGKGLRMKNLKP